MSKFKVGDKVRLISNNPLMCGKNGVNQTKSSYNKGHETTVKRVDNAGRFMMECDSSIWHYKSDWELVEEGLTRNGLKGYVKKNGITKVRITEKYVQTPAGTVLYFGLGKHGAFGANDGYTDGKNKQFGYDFNYQYGFNDSGHDNLRFVLVDKELETPNKKLIKDKMDIKKMDKSILAEANKEVLEDVADSQKEEAKVVLRELYDRKNIAEVEFKAAKERLDEVLNELKAVKPVRNRKPVKRRGRGRPRKNK